VVEHPQGLTKRGVSSRGCRYLRGDPDFRDYLFDKIQRRLVRVEGRDEPPSLSLWFLEDRILGWTDNLFVHYRYSATDILRELERDRAGRRPPVERTVVAAPAQSPESTRGYRKLDLPLVHEMRERIADGRACNPWEASGQVVDRAAGSKNEESKRKRLCRLFFQTFSEFKAEKF
jgi:hypothetical protein